MKSLLLTILLFLELSQVPVPTANGSIEGSVMLDGTSRPLPGVSVTTDSGGLQATTDAAGKFSIKNVPPGRYFVSVPGDQYARPPKGGDSKRIVVGAGEVVRGVDLTMMLMGIVTGRVTYPDGRPVEGMNVGAVAPVYRGDQVILSRPVIWRTTLTDSAGAYRLPTVDPGEYYIAVWEPRGLKPSSTYFPATADPLKAKSVVVTQGTEVVANVELPMVPRFKVSGKIVDEVPASGSHTLYALYLRNRNTRMRDDAAADEFSSSSGVVGGPQAKTNAEVQISPSQDQFEFQGIRAGSYDLFAIISSGIGTNPPVFSQYVGRTAIEVGDQDVTGAAIVVRPGMDIGVKVTGVMSNRIRLVSSDDYPSPAVSDGTRLAAFMDVDGKPRIHNVWPGAYSIRFEPEPSSDAYLADVYQNGKSIFDSGLSVGTAPVDPIEAIIGEHGATIQGTVQSAGLLAASYARIALVPDAPRRHNPQLFKSAIADSQGRFTIRGIAPGEYKLFAFDNPPSGALGNSDFISRYESSGVPVTVNPGASITMQPRLIVAPDK